MTSSMRLQPLLALVASLAVFAPGPAVGWVLVGDPGNPVDDEISCKAGAQLYLCRTDNGSVAYSFAISEHETTNEEYVEFLNAVAA